MKPLPNKTIKARAKGGRASGGTRYYNGKSKGEDKMIYFIQRALNKKEKKVKHSLMDLSINELITILKFSYNNKFQEVEDKCFRNKK